jgi:arylformamidase
VGTHADAPLHVRDGWPDSATLDVGAFLGPAHVVDATGAGAIDEAVLAGALDAGATRVLIRTGVSITAGTFPAAWPVIAESAAWRLVETGVRLVGVDAPSMDARESKALPVHHILLDAGVAVVENLDLRGIEPGEWELVALPMRIAGLDAAPVRALLRRGGAARAPAARRSWPESTTE